MAKTKPKAARPEPPRQRCRRCGEWMTLTRESLDRYYRVEALRDVLCRGTFYICPCTPHDIQVRDETAWRALVHEAYQRG